MTRGIHAGYRGQLHEASGCMYSLGRGYRFYLPHPARFTRPDASAPFERGGLNSYAYCAADPINFADPSGAVLERLIALFTSLAKPWRAWQRQIARLSTPELVTRAATGATVLAAARRLFNAAIASRGYPLPANAMTGSAYMLGGTVLYPAIDQLAIRLGRAVGPHLGTAARRLREVTARPGQSLSMV